MSGGSHNYVCYTIENNLCGQTEDKEIDDLMEDIAKLAHDLEWYHSADIGREDYMSTVREFKRKWFEMDRTERLKVYVDKSIEELRVELYRLLGKSKEDT